MPRKPNYDFERRERERIKAEKLAEKAKIKAEEKLKAQAEQAEKAETADKPNSD